MENFLFSLESIIANWLSSCSLSWESDIILGFLCGLGLYIVILRFLNSIPSFPLPRKDRNTRKPQMQWKARKRSRKKYQIWKAYKECLKELEEAKNLVLLLQSHLEKHPDKGEFQDTKAAPAGAHRSCLKDPAPAVTTTRSVNHKEDKFISMKIPLDAILKSSPPGDKGNSCVASPMPAMAGLGLTNYPFWLWSWWWATTKALFFPASSRCKPQPQHLPQHLSGTSFWGGPTSTHVEIGRPSFIDPDVQRLLEILISKRAQLSIWKENHGSFQKQKSSVYHLNFLEDITFSPLLQNKEEKVEQLSNHQHLSYMQDIGDYLHQKCSCWGLPSLHSESLVALLMGSTSQPQASFILFNGNSNCFPHTNQPITPSNLSQAVFRPHPGVQIQTLAGNFLQSQPRSLSQDQTHHIPHHPIQPQIRYCGVSSPTDQSKAQAFIPTDIQCQEWSVWQTQLQRMSLSPEVQNSEQLFSQVPPRLSEDSYAFQAHSAVCVPHGDLVRGNRQASHLQEWLLRGDHQDGLPHRFQAVESMQPQGQLPGEFPALGSQQPSLSPMSSYKNCWAAQEISCSFPRKSYRKNRLRILQNKKLNKGLGLSLRRISKDESKGLVNFIVKVLLLISEELQRHPARPFISSLGSCSSRGPEGKQLEKVLKAHLGKKRGQVTEGLIPVSVRRSWLAANLASSTHNTERDPIKLAPLKGRASCLNTSHKLPFLSPRARQELEAHMIRFRVRQKWGSYPQPFEAMHIKEYEAKPMSVPRPGSPNIVTCESRTQSKDNLANSLGKPPQACLEEKVLTKESVSTPIPVSPSSSPSSVREETQKALGGTPPDHDQGLSKVLLTGEENRPPIKTSVPSPVSSSGQSETVLEAEMGNPAPTPSTEMTTNKLNEETGDPITQELPQKIAALKRNLEAKSTKVKEDLKLMETKEAPAWEVNLGPSEPDSAPTGDVNVKNSPSSRSSNTILSPIACNTPNPKEPHLKTVTASKFEIPGKVVSEKQPQVHATEVLPKDSCTEGLLLDYGTGVLLPGCTTTVLLPDSRTNVLLAANTLSSAKSLCDIQEENGSGDTPAPQETLDSAQRGQGSQEHQEPTIPKVKGEDERKTQTSTGETVHDDTPTDEREDVLSPIDEEEKDSKPKSTKQEKHSPEERTSQTNEISHPAQVGETEKIQGSKTLLPEKELISPESYLRKRMRHFLECQKRNKKDKGQEEHLQKAKPAPATGQSQEGIKRRLTTHRAMEVQMIAAAVGHILVEKLGLSQGIRASEVKQDKEQRQVAVGRHSCCHSTLTLPAQQRVMRDTTCSHQATPQGHSCPIRKGAVRHRVLSPREQGSPARPGQHRPREAGPCDHIHHSPTIRLVNRVLSGPPARASPVFTDRKTIQENVQYRRKSFFPHNCTSSLC
ncbi:spermatogenesis-associated protein 31E1-like [Talpa occidentalis]|uniref:spermatogenesis-associated protein 31E1-like n=1 Tax=Talpa occidentalis TaxID=50954 RepID=UPI001890A314|nr:spermatogenesis-associated protein 31E1-like [Talpa occidentalis]